MKVGSLLYGRWVESSDIFCTLSESSHLEVGDYTIQLLSIDTNFQTDILAVTAQFLARQQVRYAFFLYMKNARHKVKQILQFYWTQRAMFPNKNLRPDILSQNDVGIKISGTNIS